MSHTDPVLPTVIVLIRTSLREDVDHAAYEELASRMDEIVRSMPGFVEAKDYKSDDGDVISFVTFASLAALKAWRDHPEHVAAQREGRERHYATYDVRICTVQRAYRFSALEGRFEHDVRALS